ncbi:MAG: triose-phosphate isomerase, partial [Candidatus Desulfofervidaceae bacterium]|nr:triose-phosphate isomerase [Candidatus Desulfofervidaceae bacterium]
MNRRPFIAGNWKMYKTIAEAINLVKGLLSHLPDPEKIEVAVAPPFTALYAVATQIKNTALKLAAQDTFWEKEGAYTGEISPLMLKDIGCEYVIIGHSERRQYFGETNQTVAKKIKAALTYELKPILCVGESLQQREKGQTFEVVKTQLLGGLEGIPQEEMKKLTIAYEPVWAIGTGKTASPAQAQEVHAYLRKVLTEKWGGNIAESIRILYGGSVK